MDENERYLKKYGLPDRVSMLERIINNTLPYYSVEVSVSLLQRLHKKNEQLQAEIETLKAALLWSGKFDNVTVKDLREFLEARE